ncbi:MAG: hypothetical protein ACI8P0_003362 [Planctomycetaceae bacterium]|jgi:hypothetical protein
MSASHPDNLSFNTLHFSLFPPTSVDGSGCLPTSVRTTRGNQQVLCRIRNERPLSFHDAACKQTRPPRKPSCRRSAISKSCRRPQLRQSSGGSHKFETSSLTLIRERATYSTIVNDAKRLLVCSSCVCDLHADDLPITHRCCRGRGSVLPYLAGLRLIPVVVRNFIEPFVGNPEFAKRVQQHLLVGSRFRFRRTATVCGRHAAECLPENFRLNTECRRDQSHRAASINRISFIPASKYDRPRRSIRNQLLTRSGIVVAIPWRRRTVPATGSRNYNQRCSHY